MRGCGMGMRAQHQHGPSVPGTTGTSSRQARAVTGLTALAGDGGGRRGCASGPFMPLHRLADVVSC
jgi:hypothetical protein